LAEDTIIANAIVSLTLHPTAASVDDDTVDKDHHRRGRHQPLLPSMMTTIAAVNNKHDRWLLAVVIFNCVAVAMVVIDGGNSSYC
jgi:hypothetical protein